MKRTLNLFLLAFFFIHCSRNKTEPVVFPYTGKPNVPASIKERHDTILNQISHFTSLPDSSGKLAIKLKELMAHHFGEEEEYVLPALGVLPLLANGNLPVEKEKLVLLIDRFKSNFTHMLAEHQLIKAYLGELIQMSEKEHHPGLEFFKKELDAHASEEEEVFFPTVILIGEYLKMKVEG